MSKENEEMDDYFSILESKIPSITPSEEQQKIIKSIENGNHVHISAVAGSGKTTTILLFAKQNKHKKLLHLTYNKFLQLESLSKYKAWQTENSKVFTIHGFGQKYYNNNCFTDNGIINALQNGQKKQTNDSYEILFVDECQDLTMLYFHFIRKIIKDFNIKQLVLLGDPWQSIYQYKGSDARFLTLAESIFQLPFDRLTLNQSFRLTKPMADFVNIISNSVIETQKSGPKVKYLCLSREKVAELIIQLLKTNDPEDIFILSSSVGKDRYLKYVVNKLSDKNVPIFVADNDEKLNDEVIKGKLVFSTVHAAKGRERDVVVFAPFGTVHYVFNKDKNPNMLTEELYVGLTRAKKELYILPDWEDTGRALPVVFMNLFTNADCIEIDPELLRKYHLNNQQFISSPHYNINPADFSRHLDDNISHKVEEMKERLFNKIEMPDKTDIGINCVTESTVLDSKESISDITGIFVPLLQFIKENETKKELFPDSFIYRLKEPLQKIKGHYPPRNIEECLKLAACIGSKQTGFIFKIKQIKEYKWITDKIADKIYERYKKFNSEILRLEIPLELTTENILPLPVKFIGSIDGETKTHYHEYKFVHSLTAEHFLQVLLYAYIITIDAQTENIPIKKFLLVNYRKNEVYESADFNEKNNADYLIKQISEIIQFKLEPTKLTNTEFIKKASDVKFLFK